MTLPTSSSTSALATPTTHELVCRAWQAGVVIPAFNVPYLPMVEPIVAALRDCDAVGLIQVARLEWEKFSSRSLEAVADAYGRHRDERFTRLHLDHVPVVDEDGLHVDYRAIIGRAIRAGYQSVMVDGSRLSLDANIAATREVVRMAHEAGIAAEAELGAVLGHEAGPLPPYDEIFASGRGFTAPAEAKQFVAKTGVDWLSVAIGNIHGAISGVARTQKKIEARLDIGHLDRIRAAVNLPLVLHGGSGIKRDCLQESFRHGIAKINVGSALRLAYEKSVSVSAAAARDAVYAATVDTICAELGARGTATRLAARSSAGATHEPAGD
jgi:fructose-bisphosphate aldolase, class II